MSSPSSSDNLNQGGLTERIIKVKQDFHNKDLNNDKENTIEEEESEDKHSEESKDADEDSENNLPKNDSISHLNDSNSKLVEL